MSAYYSGPQTNVTGLCPTGFIIPTRDDFATLHYTFGGTGANSSDATVVGRYTNPAIYNGIYSGQSDSSGSPLSYHGTGGFWWSSTPYNSYQVYNLNLRNGGVESQFSSYFKSYGLSIRCLK